MMNNDLICDFLGDSLELWKIAGKVEPGRAPAVAVIRTDDGTIVWIERPSSPEVPFFWFVRWRPSGAAPGGPRETRPRPCASLVGLLNTIRSALNTDRGSAVRIAPEPRTDA